MDKEKIKENIERLKLLAEDFLIKNKRIFIKDLNNNYFFADILGVGEDYLYIQCFAPSHRIGERIRVNWFSIVLMEEYREDTK